MKPMSESSTDLAARVKKLEDTPATTAETNRTGREESIAKLRQRRQEMEDAFDSETEDLRAAVAGAGDKVRRWRTDVTAPAERRIEAMRADHAERKAEHEVERAQRAADEAEEEAAATIAIAAYCVNAAEYAVLQAPLARRGQQPGRRELSASWGRPEGAERPRAGTKVGAKIASQ
jgi:hypothetical protein